MRIYQRTPSFYDKFLSLKTESCIMPRGSGFGLASLNALIPKQNKKSPCSCCGHSLAQHKSLANQKTSRKKTNDKEEK